MPAALSLRNGSSSACRRAPYFRFAEGKAEASDGIVFATAMDDARSCVPPPLGLSLFQGNAGSGGARRPRLLRRRPKQERSRRRAAALRYEYWVEWPASREDLIEWQRSLGAAASPLWRPPAGAYAIGGCFVCFPRGGYGAGEAGDPAWAAACVQVDGRTVACAVRDGEAGAAYTPGLLALREGPLLEAVVRGLPRRPDVLLVNAGGQDHPRRAGLATELGAVLDLPSVGVTHRPLIAVGDWPADCRGASSPLRVEGSEVGAWLRVCRGVRPLAVHPAWRTDVAIAAAVVLAATRDARTPAPLREARRLARVARARGFHP